jgi:hypothetical protein
MEDTVGASLGSTESPVFSRHDGLKAPVLRAGFHYLHYEEGTRLRGTRP